MWHIHRRLDCGHTLHTHTRRWRPQRGGAGQEGGAKQVRGLKAVERRHRAYGAAIAEANGPLRPHLKVSVAAPEGLEEELTRLSPELVVCATDAVDPTRR